MELAVLVQDIHRLNHELERFERKCGIMSDTFYESYNAGGEPEDDAWALDFEKWAGLYQVRRDRQQACERAMQRLRRDPRSLVGILRPVTV